MLLFLHSLAMSSTAPRGRIYQDEEVVVEGEQRECMAEAQNVIIAWLI